MLLRNKVTIHIKLFERYKYPGGGDTNWVKKNANGQEIQNETWVRA